MKKNLGDYLFYKLVEFTIFAGGYDNIYRAVGMMSVLFLFNVLSILMWFIDISQTKMIAIISMCVFAFLNIILAIAYWGKRGKRIWEYYEEESEEERIKGNTIVIWYVVLTIAIFAVSLYLWTRKS